MRTYFKTSTDTDFQFFPTNIWILKIFFLVIFAIKMSWMCYWISLNKNVIILIASLQPNLKFKIQMVAGNQLKICVRASFEISSTLIMESPNQTCTAQPSSDVVGEYLTKNL